MSVCVCVCVCVCSFTSWEFFTLILTNEFFYESMSGFLVSSDVQDNPK